MQIIKGSRPRPTYPHDPIWYMDFEGHVHNMRDGYLFIADSCDELFSGKHQDKERIFLTFEEPNFCTDADNQHARLAQYADTILTLCPYTTAADTTGKRKQVFIPYPESMIQTDFTKEHDVIYCGHYPQVGFWPKLIESIKKYNYIDIQYARGNHSGCTYRDKILYYAHTKIAIVHNTSPVGTYADRFRAFPNAKNNRAFDWLQVGILPQLKSRTIEAAFNKCIILCLRDSWNVIEQYLEPEKDFIYFDSQSDAEEKIKAILADYHKHVYLAENAYKKVIDKYTVKHFCEKHLT